MRIRFFISFIILSLTAKAYDFSSVCPSGQELYYIVTDVINMSVCVTFPGPTIDSAYYNIEKPAGDLIIPETVESDGVVYSVNSIGTCAFAKCTGLDGDLVIPPSIRSIGRYAFLDCGNIPRLFFNAKECIEAFAAFEGCMFDDIKIGDAVTFIPYGIFANSKRLTCIYIPKSVKSIGRRAFFGCIALSDVIIEASLLDIGEYAFSDCQSLSSVGTLNSNTIGMCAFYGAHGLKKVCFGDNVKTIGEQAFVNCFSIESLELGSGLDTIKDYAFYWCGAIDTVFCQSTVPPFLGGCAFSESVCQSVLSVPCGSETLYNNATGWNCFGNIAVRDQLSLESASNVPKYGYVVASDSLFCLGDVATVEAVASGGFLFSSWSDGVFVNPRDVTIVSDTLMMACFVPDTINDVPFDDWQGGISAVYADGRNICVEASVPQRVRIYNVVGLQIYDRITVEEKHCFPVGSAGVYLVLTDDKNARKVIVE